MSSSVSIPSQIASADIAGPAATRHSAPSRLSQLLADARRRREERRIATSLAALEHPGVIADFLLAMRA